MADEERSLEDKKWNQLTSQESDRIIFIYREHGKFHTNIVRTMSDILFNWLFILNSGGLLSIVTIFASSQEKQKFIELCFKMGVCFTFGLIFIYLAARLELYRFNKNGKHLDNSFDSLQIGNITIGKYLNDINTDAIPSCLITMLEIVSFILFCIGLIFGFIFEMNYI